MDVDLDVMNVYYLFNATCLIVKYFKGIFHPKLKILSLITHHYVVPNP